MTDTLTAVQKPVRLLQTSLRYRVIAIGSDNRPVPSTDARFADPRHVDRYAEDLIKDYGSAQINDYGDVYIPRRMAAGTLVWERVVEDGWYPADAIEEGR